MKYKKQKYKNTKKIPKYKNTKIHVLGEKYKSFQRLRLGLLPGQAFAKLSWTKFRWAVNLGPSLSLQMRQQPRWQPEMEKTIAQMDILAQKMAQKPVFRDVLQFAPKQRKFNTFSQSL